MSPATRSSSWAWLGLAALVIGYFATWVVVFLISEADAKAGGPVLIDAIEADSNQLIFRVTSGLGVIAACLLLVYGAGARRTLREALPAGSLVPTVVFTSFVLAAALLASGFAARGMVFDSTGWYGDDPRIAFYVLGVDIPLAAWGMLGLAAAACAYASFANAVLPRWFGILSGIVAVLVAVVWLTGTLPPGNIVVAPWLIASVFAFRAVDARPHAVPTHTTPRVAGHVTA